MANGELRDEMSPVRVPVDDHDLLCALQHGRVSRHEPDGTSPDNQNLGIDPTLHGRDVARRRKDA